jgi:dTDP-4-amino-4,6-dideoxygalactose transaminase
MARTGLLLGLQELIRPGQTIVMSPLTIVDMVNMVLLAGGIPVFADICRRSCTIDPGLAESLIDQRTGAVLVTHLHGENAGAHVFHDLCRRRGVPLIEDSAQAFGAIEKGRRLGTIGDLGIYSFGFYKNLNVWQGGMVVSPDTDLITRIRRRVQDLPALSRWHLLGTSLRGLIIEIATWPPLFATLTHPVLRFSFLHRVAPVNRLLDPEYGATRLAAIPSEYIRCMSGQQADLALILLDRVDPDADARISHSALYETGLSGIDDLIRPVWRPDGSHVYTHYPIQYRDREGLLREALGMKRDFAAQHLRNCADLLEFQEFYRDCPQARAAAQELILLPTYPRYPTVEIKRNIDVIQRFFRLRSTV